MCGRRKTLFIALLAAGALHGDQIRAQQPVPTGPAPATLVPSQPASAPESVAPPSPPPLETPLQSKLGPLAETPDWKQLEACADILSREEFETAISSIYTNGSNFPVPWRIDDEAVTVQTSPGQAPLRVKFRQPEEARAKVSRFWRRPSELPVLKEGEPVLKGLHIALDPGHIGGGFAQMEERWLSMKPGEAIMEGQLVLYVANLLKPRLEALGARVSLVRDREEPVTKMRLEDFREVARKILLDSGITSFQDTYQNRLDEARILTLQWQQEKLFYRVSEIQARAVRVNKELHPDLVLCLHLNAEAWGDPMKPAFVDKNHLHLLINGCYGPDELQYEDVRYGMLRRLFMSTESEERGLADVVSRTMAAATGLPPYQYNTSNARRVSANPYVYARNLLANRLYECPVLYFEPYVMNHEETYKRLLLGHYLGRTLLDGKLVSSPLEDYVRGVTTGLIAYYGKARHEQP